MMQNKKQKLEVIVDKKKAFDVVSVLFDACSRKYGILETLDDFIPEIKLPSNVKQGSKSHLNFLIISSVLDGARKSKRVYETGRHLISNYSIEELCLMNEDELKEVLRQRMDNGLGNPAQKIKAASQKIFFQYKGDPRDVFCKLRDFDEVRKKAIEFEGIGRQKANLLIKNMIKSGFVKLNDEYDAAIKIDRWAIRMAVGTGIAHMRYSTGKKITAPVQTSTHKLEVPLENCIREITKNSRFDPKKLNDIIYAIGSSVCSRKDYAACSIYCPLECSMLVKSNPNNTYMRYPSEARIAQLPLF